MLSIFIILSIISSIIIGLIWAYKSEKKLVNRSDQKFETAKKNVQNWINHDNYTYLEASDRIWKEFKDIRVWTVDMNRTYFRLLGYVNGRVNCKNRYKTELSDFRNGYYI